MEGDLSSNNELLEKDTVEQSEKGIYLHPGIAINGNTYRGYLESDDIHEAICASFEHTPDACRDKFERLVEKVEEMIFEAKSANAKNKAILRRHAMQ